MSHLSRIFLTLVLIFPPFWTHKRPTAIAHLRNWDNYRFRFPAYRQFSNSSTEVLRCFTRSLTLPPKMHSGAWQNWIPGARWHIGALR
jgi:hypothetical protein